MSGGSIPFTDNYSDLSNNDGYQFEFRCERCGNGYRSAFQRDAVSFGQGLLRAAGSLFGGKVQDLGYAADSMLNRQTNSAAKDRALARAVEQIAPQFTQCRGCGDWVCRDVCWNDEVGQCVRCSPRIHDELGGLQAEARRRQVRERLESTNLTASMDVAAAAVVSCPTCGARTAGGKFCSECGSALATTVTCPSCQAENRSSAKFCAECGTGLRR